MTSTADDVGFRQKMPIEAWTESDLDRGGSEETRSSDYAGRMIRLPPVSTRNQRQWGVTGSNQSMKTTMHTNETNADSRFGRTDSQQITTRQTAGERR